MKKIILSIFAIALVVACDKGDSYETLDPAAEISVLGEVIIDSSISDALNSAKSVLLDAGLVSAVNKKLDESASRGGSDACADHRPETPAGKAVVDFQFLPIDGSETGWFITRGGGDISFNISRPIVRFLVGSSSEDIQIQLFVQGANGEYGDAIPVGSTGYNIAFSDAVLGADGYVGIDKTDLYLDSITPDVADTSDDAGISCGPSIQSLYEVTPAPFPLVGFLATLNSDAVLTGSSSNYAASSEAEVRAAIEADISDNN